MERPSLGKLLVFRLLLARGDFQAAVSLGSEAQPWALLTLVTWEKMGGNHGPNDQKAASGR